MSKNASNQMKSEAIEGAYKLEDSKLAEVTGGLPGSGPLTAPGEMMQNMFSSVDSETLLEIQNFQGEHLSETDMIKFNMAASRYNMVTELTSNLVRELTDAERRIADSM